MTKIERPAIVLVDDDRAVLGAVEMDVRRRYASNYRVLSFGTGADALQALDRLALRGDRAALIVADQRMPRLNGTELLNRVSEGFPDARRVLLTAYADTQAAIDAINRAHVDYYILKPWDPPEEKLYPVLDELLEEWQATTRRAVGGLRVVGDRWSAASYAVRDFLSRNQVPYRWLDISRSQEAQVLVDSAGADRLPLVFLEDGTVMANPELGALAKAVGMQPATDTEHFDVVVVGAGPAGLAAAVYAASEGLSTAIVEREAPGGQAGMSSRIENYLGFPHGVSGAELARRALAQATRFGASLISPCRAAHLRRADPYRVIELEDGASINCSAAIIATGVRYLAPETPGFDRLTGRGIYYGSVASEARDLAGEHVLVLGGGNSAGQAAVYLARFADRVTLVVRGETLGAKMSSYLVDQIHSTANIDVRLGTVVKNAIGEERLERVELTAPAGPEELAVAALFVFIGARPRTDWLSGSVARDERGYVQTGQTLRVLDRWSLDRDPYLLETSVPGVFAVGDVRSDSVKRVATAVGEGAVAVKLVHEYLQG